MKPLEEIWGCIEAFKTDMEALGVLGRVSSSLPPADVGPKAVINVLALVRKELVEDLEAE